MHTCMQGHEKFHFFMAHLKQLKKLMHCQISIYLGAHILATQKAQICTVAHLLIWVQHST